MCSEGAKDAITNLREVATCQYRLTFSSARICAHPAFRAPEAPVHHVMCVLDAGSAAESSHMAGAPGDAGDGGGTPAGEDDPPLASGSDAGDPGVAAEEGVPSGSLEDLRQAIKDVGEDLGVNTTSMETALLNAHDGESDQVWIILLPIEHHSRFLHSSHVRQMTISVQDSPTLLPALALVSPFMFTSQHLIP